MQNCYSLLYREEEREMMPTLAHFGVGSMPWSPLARGLLTRPWTAPGAAKSTRQNLDVYLGTLYAQDDANKSIVDRLEEVAKRLDASMAQTALAWLMTKPAVAAPIVGTSSMENLLDLLGASLNI